MGSSPVPLDLDFQPQLTGLFSSPARQNPTMPMVEAAYKHHCIYARYLTCEVSPDGLGDAVRGARAMGWIGFNLSIPHKVAILKYLDKVGKSASLIGAVNTVVHRDGQLIGENTDGVGFLISLKTITDPAGKNLVILGAGGAARAIAIESALAGARSIIVVNRSSERGKDLAGLIAAKTSAKADFVSWNATYRIPAQTDILVNATSVGFYPEVDMTVDVDLDTLRSSVIVADVIPNPPQTVLLRRATEIGCTTLDGLGMLVYQGVAGIQHWTGVSVDPTIMRNVLEEIFHVKKY